MYAVMNRNEDEVKLLIKRGVDCLVQINDVSTPLSRARSVSPFISLNTLLDDPLINILYSVLT